METAGVMVRGVIHLGAGSGSRTLGSVVALPEKEAYEAGVAEH